MPDKPAKWSTESETVICETRVFDVIKKKMRMPGGAKSSDFFTLKAPDWVNVIAIDENNEVILVEQYRHGTDDISLEIPGGVIEATHGNNPLEAAKRELKEETGYESDNWTHLGSVSSNPALFNNYCHVFLAENCRKSGNQELDKHEDISVRKMSYYDFCESALDGRIHHALAIAALAKYQVYRRREYYG
ncbi:MAG: NUDIX hydrolase [Balneolia bacterium]|nr:NUDIX hydrolase [Balneolia bacterium]